MYMQVAFRIRAITLCNCRLAEAHMYLQRTDTLIAIAVDSQMAGPAF